MTSPLHKDAPHESGHLHVTGRARYVADDPGPPGTVVAFPICSTVARGVLMRRDATAARDMPGVHAVLFAEDIPGARTWGAIVHDEPLLATGRVHCVGQAIGLVIADTEAQARAAAEAVHVEVSAEEPVLDIDQAIAAGAFHTAPHVIERGDLDAAFAHAADIIEGTVRVPGQDHFYLETQAALVMPEEDGTWHVRSSTQHPTEVQRVVAATLGVPDHRVTCEVPRLGGGFGGKESQASPFAAFAALGAWATGRACRCWLHRHQDMQMTGGRHPFLGRYRAAFDPNGRILGFQADLFSDGGWTLDLSGPVMDRALFHADSAYFIPALRLEGRVCATNLPSNTAFRGFGGPQGMMLIEDALNQLAEVSGRDAAALRQLNLYGPAPRDRTPYGQVVADNRLQRLVPELLESADHAARIEAIVAFNADSNHAKRGLALQPVKFGISFTNSFLNQAHALVLVYADGTVQVNHGGTEMGQGLHTKMQAVAADALGLSVAEVRVMHTRTDKVPNTSATAASSGSDLNGAAVLAACSRIRERMAGVAAGMLGGAASQGLVFDAGQIRTRAGEGVPFAAVAAECQMQRVPLFATGSYATPGIAYDAQAGRGTPFFYYAFGAALSEVEVSALTGEYRVRRVDILHDVGDSLVPSIDRGQVEGAFVQGMGWLTCEELRRDGAGRLLTRGPGTYKIPAAGDVPLDLRVALLDRADNPRVVGGSKAVGEPPFMLAISVVSALRHAIAAFGDGGAPVDLALPATPEAVLRAIVAQHQAGGARAYAAAR